MKRFIRLIVLSAIILYPDICFAENEYLNQEILNTNQEGEVVLVVDENETLTNLSNQETNTAVSANDDDDIFDGVEEEFKVFEQMGKKQEPSTTEESLYTRILKTNITRTDIPSFLLKDELTHEFSKGPIKELQLFGGYRGSISAILAPRKYATKYDNLTTEVGFFGKLKNPNYEFKLSFLPVVKEGVNYLDAFWGDAYIAYNKIPNHRIQIGRSRGQVGIEGGTSSYTLPFVSRSQIGRNFGNLRTTAIKVIGNYNYVDYSLAFGSSGRYFTSGMPGAEFTGWINVKPFGSKDGKLGKLTIGGGLNSGHNRFNYNVGTVYVGYKHKQLWTNFEAAIADGYNGAAALSTAKAGGFAYTLGWKVKPYFQLIGRVDQFDPDRKTSHNRKTEYSAGINWFIKGQAIKLVLNYVFCENQGQKDSQRIILFTQIVL